MSTSVTDVSIAAAAALLADPARTGFLAALRDGRALPAGELARYGGVAPSTAAAHLARLVAAGILAVEARGRHRYYRLATPAVVGALDALAAIARPTPRRVAGAPASGSALRAARTCYDHLAGVAGVALTEALVARGVLAVGADGFVLTPEGAAFLARFGLDLDGARRRKRLFAPRCLDWSERRHHLAGALGAALTGRLFDRGWIARIPATRAVQVTTEGRAGLRAWLNLDPLESMAR